MYGPCSVESLIYRSESNSSELYRCLSKKNNKVSREQTSQSHRIQWEWRWLGWLRGRHICFFLGKLLPLFLGQLFSLAALACLQRQSRLRFASFRSSSGGMLFARARRGRRFATRSLGHGCRSDTVIQAWVSRFCSTSSACNLYRL